MVRYSFSHWRIYIFNSQNKEKENVKWESGLNLAIDFYIVPNVPLHQGRN